jgi:hypothetical protein
MIICPVIFQSRVFPLKMKTELIFCKFFEFVSMWPRNIWKRGGGHGLFNVYSTMKIYFSGRQMEMQI